MADIFISYRSVNRPLANRVADVLQDKGLTVWFDRELQTGMTYREEIAREIATAPIVLLIWTADALRSPWVLDEAETARRRGALLTVVVGSTVVPRNLRGTVVASINDGATGPSAGETDLIYDAVADVLSSQGDARIAAAQQRSRIIVRIFDLLFSLIYLIGTLIVGYYFDSESWDSVIKSETGTIIAFPYVMLYFIFFGYVVSRVAEYAATRLFNLNLGPCQSRLAARWIGECIGYILIFAVVMILALSSQSGFFYTSPSERQEYPYIVVWLNPTFKFTALFILLILLTLPKYIPFFISRALRRRLLM